MKEESDVEWKYARSKLYMEYIKEGSTLPVPFNIIPTPKSCINIFKKLSNLCNKKSHSMSNEETSIPQTRPIKLNANGTSNGLPVELIEFIIIFVFFLLIITLIVLIILNNLVRH